MSRVYISRPVEARFWERVNKQGPLKVKSLGRCWEWTGSTKGRVYGQIKDDNGKVESAHRVAYRLQHKRSPGKKHVLHRCDNPVCVRGSHLFLGTNKDNIEDRVRKGALTARRAPSSGEDHGGRCT